jgi:hypothetical protein
MAYDRRGGRHFALSGSAGFPSAALLGEHLEESLSFYK